MVFLLKEKRLNIFGNARLFTPVAGRFAFVIGVAGEVTYNTY